MGVETFYTCTQCGLLLDLQWFPEIDEDYVVASCLAMFGIDSAKSIAQAVENSGYTGGDAKKERENCPHALLTKQDATIFRCDSCGAAFDARLMIPLPPDYILSALRVFVTPEDYKKILKIIASAVKNKTEKVEGKSENAVVEGNQQMAISDTSEEEGWDGGINSLE